MAGLYASGQSLKTNVAAVSLPRSRIRQLTAALLLVWLFLLAAGVAQACITRGASAHASAAQHCGDHETSHEREHVTSDGEKAACEKLCTEASAPSPKNQVAQTDLPSIQALDTALPIQHWRFDPSLHTRDRDPRDAISDPPGRRISLPITFLRLTL